jgi:hypothetical protein
VSTQPLTEKVARDDTVHSASPRKQQAAPEPPAGRSRTRPAPPGEEEGDETAGTEDEDRGREPADPRAGWRKVRLGLLLLLVTTGASLALSLFSCVSGFAVSFSRNPLGASGAMSTLFIISLIFSLLQQLVTLGGYALCCAVPPRYGSRNLALAALVLGGVSLVSNTTSGILSWRTIRDMSSGMEEIGRPPAMKPGTTDPKQALEEMKRSLEEVQRSAHESVKASRFMDFFAKLQTLLQGAQYLTFAAFLLGLARSLQEPAAAANCLNLIRLSAILLAVQAMVQLITGILLWSMSLALLGIFGIIAMFVSLVALAQTVWYFLVLLEVRGLVGKRAHPRGRRKGPGQRPTEG